MCIDRWSEISLPETERKKNDIIITKSEIRFKKEKFFRIVLINYGKKCHWDFILDGYILQFRPSDEMIALIEPKQLKPAAGREPKWTIFDSWHVETFQSFWRPVRWRRTYFLGHQEFVFSKI